MDVTPGDPGAPTMIRLSGVGKTYPDGTVAVHELDLDVRRGAGHLQGDDGPGREVEQIGHATSLGSVGL